MSPATALAVGLKVDAEALTPDVLNAIRRGAVNLHDPAVTLALLNSGRVKIGTGKRSVKARLGAARYSLKAGQKKTLTIKLGKGLRPLIKKNVLKVKAQAVSSDAAGNTTTRTANLSLKLDKAKKAKK